MRPRRPGAVKQLLIIVDKSTCQRCQLNMSRFPELIQLHHMIDREVLSRAKQEGMKRSLQNMRRHLEYQQIMCPSCHANVHEQREPEFFFPNYNINTTGNNVQIAMELFVKRKDK